jgi:2',3'-cyclic-nucleotide 2'-phosphodiesterase (5'-nucleotidase family)
MTGIEGERRVKNVTVNGEAIDPERIYSVAGVNYTLLQNGDGFTAFDGADVLIEDAGLDNQILIDYITEKLGGVIGSEYADPYGQGRITFTEAR